MSILLPQHRALIEASAISDDVATARGYRSIETKAELEGLGFGRRQQRVPALLAPIHNVFGEVANYLLRPDEPRVNGNRTLKYEIPTRSRMLLDVPPGVRADIDDPAVPLFITEGTRKADAAVSLGLCCVDLIGTWSWRGTNEKGGKVALPDFESVALNDREVFICFDSDVMLKVSVHAALERFGPLLARRGANVAYVYLPPGPKGEKVGLDDFIAAGNGIAELTALAAAEIRAIDPGRPASPYEETAAGIVWHKSSEHGATTTVPLTNFTARVIGDVAFDDGVEVEQRLEIEADLHGRTSTFSLPASKFPSMGWPIEHLGAGAIIEPGQGTKDRARHAIQTLSGEVSRRIAYGHTGWREIDGEHYYLHAGGAIGAKQTLTELEIVVSDPLQPFELPVPPEKKRLREVIRSSLGLLDIADDETAFTLLAAIGRAPLGHCDVTIWLFGETGTFKSELAALCQQHWGARLDARHLPASFTATPNYIEGLLFTAKDVLTVVDDFAPEGSSYDLQRAHSGAARIVRSQGNLHARGRMRADSSLRPVKPPRGLLLATGEEVPRGHSVRARMIVVGIEAGDVSVEKLTELQSLAANGVLAETMAGYVRYLASRYEEIRSGASKQAASLRERLGEVSGHRRTPDAIAQLVLGLRYFLDYAQSAEAISSTEAEELMARGTSALERVGHLQSAYLASSEPARRFVELLGSAISSGAAHVADPGGGEPADAGAWGWRHVAVGDSASWRPQGARIGWTLDGELWLDPDAAYGVAQDLARRVGDPFTVGPTTLNKRLAERGLLATSDLETDRNCAPVRKVIGGARRQVLHLSASRLVAPIGDTEQLPFEPDGRNGRSSETYRPHDEEGGGGAVTDTLLNPDPGIRGTDHPDHASTATEDEEAEIERVSRKFGVADEVDS